MTIIKELLESYGGYIVGKGKEGFEGGILIPARTKFFVIRPGDPLP